MADATDKRYDMITKMMIVDKSIARYRRRICATRCLIEQAELSRTLEVQLLLADEYRTQLATEPDAA